ncbi:MAG: hypothetical protein ACXQTH_04595 [Dehalococcoidia bacterium]
MLVWVGGKRSQVIAEEQELPSLSAYDILLATTSIFRGDAQAGFVVT